MPKWKGVLLVVEESDKIRVQNLLLERDNLLVIDALNKSNELAD